MTNPTSHLCMTSFYLKDTEPFYHSFMCSLVSLLSGIYPLAANAFIACYKNQKKLFVNDLLMKSFPDNTQALGGLCESQDLSVEEKRCLRNSLRGMRKDGSVRFKID